MMLAVHHTGLGPKEDVRRHATGVAGFDAALSGGFAFGRVHEFYAAEAGDPAAAAFAAILAGEMAAETKPLFWLRSHKAARAAGMVQAEGWRDLGGLPHACLFVLAEDAKALLRATVDALRSGSAGGVIAETQGRMPELDLTASRRLSLAAEKSGTPLFLLFGDAQAVPSAAETRWQISSAPSRALAADAPGFPTFDLELLRQRGGQSGLSWRLEWDRDERIFIEAAATSGALVPAPLRRPAAAAGAGPVRLGQRAA
jgi:protein ImuA